MSELWGSAESCRMMADQLSDPGLPDDPEALRRLEKRFSAQRNADAAMAKALEKLHSVEIADGFDPRGFFVYVLWGHDGLDRPLYVGQSANVLNRLGTHLSEAKKRRSVERVTLVRCKDRTTMMKTELQLIRQYRPPWNIVGLHGQAVPSSPEVEVG